MKNFSLYFKGETHCLSFKIFNLKLNLTAVERHAKAILCRMFHELLVSRLSVVAELVYVNDRIIVTATDLAKPLNDLGINYLVNVGPDGLGRIPGPSAEILIQAAKLFENR